MEDYNDKRTDFNLNDSVELIKPVLVNDRKMNFQDLKSEYTKAVSYIDHLKTDKNNLIQTIKLLSNRKPSFGGLSSSASTSQLKGTLVSENDKKIVQLEQENRELRKTVSEYKKARENMGNDRKVLVALEQENMELQKTLEMKTDQIMALQKEAFAQNDRSEIEQLEKNNRQLKKQVDFLNRDIERMTQKLRDMEEENSRAAISKETSQTLIKYINYILNTINTFQPGNSMRDCFEERFTSALDVHRLFNSKDYVGLLTKCLKFISDILLTADAKTSDTKPLSTRNLNVQELLVSNILENQGIQTVKRKSLANNRPNTPLGRSSGSGTLNSSIATNCQTPSNVSIQDRRTSAIKKQGGRTLSQEIACINSTESHIVYGNSSRKPGHTKNLSLVPDNELAQDSNPILNGRRGSKTSRNEDRIGLGNTPLENIISPKVGYTSLEKDRRSKSNIAARRNPQNTPLDTSLSDKERFINERENSIAKLDNDLQNKRDKIRNLSRELDRLENREGDSLASSHVAASAERRGHKRVNTDSCISIRQIDTEADEGQNAYRNMKEEDRSVIRLKPVLKAPTYNNREREYEKDYENNANMDQYADSTTRSGFGSGAYLNPYPSANDQINDINRKFQNLESGFSTDNRGKSPIRGQSPIVGQRAESRSRIRPDTHDEISNYRSRQPDEYERPRRIEREEDQAQRYLDDDVYQPKVLPRPQPKDRLEDIGSTSLSNAFSRGKIQSAVNIGNPYESITQNRVTFEVGDNMEEEGLAERKSSSRNIGSFRSPVNANLKLRGTNYASFQVSFGRTETRDRISPSRQDSRPKSPSIIDVRAKRKIEHVVQTYDVIRGEEIKNK